MRIGVVALTVATAWGVSMAVVGGGHTPGVRVPHGPTAVVTEPACGTLQDPLGRGTTGACEPTACALATVGGATVGVTDPVG
jgi:hypothetical protein